MSPYAFDPTFGSGTRCPGSGGTPSSGACPVCGWRGNDLSGNALTYTQQALLDRSSPSVPEHRQRARHEVR